jgi:hypothetical protein
MFTDGPFLESKEYLAGFWIIEAADLDVALKLAAEGPERTPATRRSAIAMPQVTPQLSGRTITESRQGQGKGPSFTRPRKDLRGMGQLSFAIAQGLTGEAEPSRRPLCRLGQVGNDGLQDRQPVQSLDHPRRPTCRSAGQGHPDIPRRPANNRIGPDSPIHRASGAHAHTGGIADPACWP